MKFCKDCKYHKYGGNYPSICTHAVSNYDINPVSGYSYFRNCDYMRVDIYTPMGNCNKAPCGKEAKLFEQKKPWWKLW